MMEIAIDKITENGRHRNDMGDIESLAESIKRIGLLHPVPITTKNVLIAGKRRIEAYKKLGKSSIPVTVIDLDQIILGERDENEQRKKLTPSEAVALAKAVKPIERKAAKERQKRKPISSHKLRTQNHGRSDARVARSVGMSAATLQKAGRVVKAAKKDPFKYDDLREKMDATGNVSRAFNELLKRETPKRQATAIEQKTKAWNKILDNLLAFTGSILDDYGGIKGLTKGWRQGEIISYHANLVLFNKNIAAMIAALSKGLEK